MLNNKETQIINAINDGGSATFATVIAVVEVDMYKKGNPLRKSLVQKRIELSVSLNANYANAVNNQRLREGKPADFVPTPSWAVRVYDSVNGSILRHKDDENRRYLQVILKKGAPKVKPLYFVNDRLATDEEIAVIRQFRKPSEEPTNQGLNAPVLPRRIKLENIVELRSNKQVLQF
jgi:hypothetical protein